MANKWTEQQRQAIEARGGDLLVAAAAGSGKTAVLVERIITRILEEGQELDRLLVVTFTNAAASEMRQRIGAAIAKRLEENPKDVHLQNQMALLPRADIKTIHAFCLQVIREYYHLLEIDPAVRTADPAEIKLLQKEVLDELFEECYAAEEPQWFYDLLETFSSATRDTPLRELVLHTYLFAQGSPCPAEALDALAESFHLAEGTSIDTCCWFPMIRQGAETMLEYACYQIEKAYQMAEEVEFEGYHKLLEKETAMLRRLRDAVAEPYAAWRLPYLAVEFARLPAYRGERKAEAERIKELRNEAKDTIKKLGELYFAYPPEMQEELVRKLGGTAERLARLTKAFMQAFAAAKKEKNVIDFNDYEHFALQILLSPDGTPTEAAAELRQKYDEIMIDEYQDSNLVQEYILTSISGKAFDRNNLFMVGDIKQSIYRFRQARPELFMEKQECYTVEESSSQKINLSKNFRSRKEVLDTVNYIFRRLMIKDFGNIAYDDQAALYCGAAMPEPEKQEDIKPELMILDLQEEEAADKTELEAAMVAVRILELKKTAKVTDKLSGKLRKAEFGDMVILLRSMSGKSDVFSNVLSSYGIPSVTGTSTGYFSSPEIQTMLNFLTVLDNCRQDIPLSAVLHSPIGGITSLEMAQIRSAYPELLFSEACICYAQEGKEDQVKQKLIKFFRLFLTLRQEAEYLPIHKLLWEIYDKTSYERIVRMQPNGEVRRANLQMLVQKALDYENTSYRGLFNFVRYIENLQKYEVDYGMAETGAGEKNAVQIMSIHKSKGLEFPIVFVSCLAKSFNKQDAREKLAIHPDLGLGIDAVDPEKRLKMPTLHKKVIQKKIEQESLGEELRVLYVALTRAKEKLIMTASLEQAERKLEKVQEMAAFFVRTSYEKLWSGGSFLDWIIGACEDGEFPFELRLVSAQELVEKKVAELSLKSFDYEFLRQRKTEISKELAERLTYQYPYQKWETIPGKVSVSELKREDFEENISRVFEEEEMETYVPIFLREEKKMSRAERGTIYHKITENMAFEKIRHSDQAKEEIEALVRKRKISEEEAKAVNPYDFYLFAQTELYRRIGEAKKRNQFYPEQMFVIAKPANEIYPECESTQDVLVQGIIDACFEENGDYVLIDYKTDYVKNEQELVQRYKVQIKIYAEALTQMTGKKVKECLIYSFCLGKEIVLDVDMDHVIG